MSIIFWLLKTKVVKLMQSRSELKKKVRFCKESEETVDHITLCIHKLIINNEIYCIYNNKIEISFSFKVNTSNSLLLSCSHLNFCS